MMDSEPLIQIGLLATLALGWLVLKLVAFVRSLFDRAPDKAKARSNAA